jgi:DNA modification methylase
MYNIINGDCLEGLLALDTGIADIALIDPPYFNYVTGHRKDKEDKLSKPLVQQSRDDQLRTVQECIRVLKEGSSFWFFTNWQEAWWFQARFHTFLRNEVIWDKGNWAAGDLEGSLANKYEVVFLGTKGKGWKYKGARIHDIWEIPRMGTNRIHSTEKPVDLYKKIIDISTEPGALVIDPYCGSGSSAEASIQLGRNFLGWEIDEEYYKRILSRLGGIQK